MEYREDMIDPPILTRISSDVHSPQPLIGEDLSSARCAQVQRKSDRDLSFPRRITENTSPI